ncbi:protein FAR1-related sequence 5 [Tanacetum coccineum]
MPSIVVVVAVRSYELNALCTPESFVTHSNFDTPGGTIYYIPKVYADVLLVKGNVYDSVDDCVVAYMKYAAEAGFVVRRSCQKRMLNEDVKQKYLVCNRMGCPKGIHVDTLDLGNINKPKRHSNLHITGCKAHAVFNLDTRTRKFVLNVFDTIHNHELELEEYKHLSKTERQLTYIEQAFIVKAASVNIGATRAHHLLTGIKGFYLLVYGTTIDFKNFFRSVNCYIGDSDAHMLIHKMENRKKHADEVSKYNYREFGDVVSFDATFKTNNLRSLQVMVAPIISISSDSSEESVGSHAPRVILFGAIPAIIPVIPEVPIVPADPIVAPEEGIVSVVSPVTPPNRVPSDLASGGVTFMTISSTNHKERSLRINMDKIWEMRLAIDFISSATTS